MKQKISFGKKVLIYTNPLSICIGAGILTSAFLASVFGGTYRNMKQIMNKI